MYNELCVYLLVIYMHVSVYNLAHKYRISWGFLITYLMPSLQHPHRLIYKTSCSHLHWINSWLLPCPLTLLHQLLVFHFSMSFASSIPSFHGAVSSIKMTSLGDNDRGTMSGLSIVIAMCAGKISLYQGLPWTFSHLLLSVSQPAWPYFWIY